VLSQPLNASYKINCPDNSFDIIMPDHQCRICSNANDNKTYVAREMMYGLRDCFAYFQCSSCGCLQIADIPENIGKYYPEQYFQMPSAADMAPVSKFKGWMLRRRTSHLLGEHNLPGMLMDAWRKAPSAPVFSGWNWAVDARRFNLDLDSAILDVGGGNGMLLYFLRRQGFSNLTGVDPYVKEDVAGEGVRIHKKEIMNLEGCFDFIMLHHSFEHIENPKMVFASLQRLLKPNGNVLLRIPVSDSMAWIKYQVNWVQLDAPRHFFLHTVKSIKILAEEHGLRVADVVYDSTEFQFQASELYLKDVALVEALGNLGSYFSADENAEFAAEAFKLNQDRQGDQACFYLSRV